jgi:MYXO-CTERM domain-containing protein
VLLVGDATFDPRNFTGRGDLDFVPTKLVDAADMETSSDDWFADLGGDGMPDLAIGRLPVHTAAEAKAVVDKILGYGGKDELPRGGLFVTDQQATDLDFEGASAASAASVADLMPVESYMRAAGTPGLMAKLRAGPFLVNYFGHGSVEVWDGLLARADVAALDNPHLSIYVAMNCLNGFFHDLYTTSLAESLLLAPGGAVAVWASSTLTAFDSQAAMNKAFLSRLTRMSLGQAALAAKRGIPDADARRTWMLFGDPTLFGAPGPLPTDADAGAPSDDASAPSDGGPPDADQPDAVAPTPDAGVIADAAKPDAPPVALADGATADAADAGKPSGGGGCSCQTVPSSPSVLGLMTLLLAFAFRRRR